MKKSYTLLLRYYKSTIVPEFQPTAARVVGGSYAASNA